MPLAAPPPALLLRPASAGPLRRCRRARRTRTGRWTRRARPRRHDALRGEQALEGGEPDLVVLERARATARPPRSARSAPAGTPPTLNAPCSDSATAMPKARPCQGSAKTSSPFFRGIAAAPVMSAMRRSTWGSPPSSPRAFRRRPRSAAARRRRGGARARCGPARTVVVHRLPIGTRLPGRSRRSGRARARLGGGSTPSASSIRST